MPPHLAVAYRACRYQAAGVDLRIGRRSRALDGLLAGMGAQEAVLITASNPNGRRAPAGCNARMMARLHAAPRTAHGLSRGERHRALAGAALHGGGTPGVDEAAGAALPAGRAGAAAGGPGTVSSAAVLSSRAAVLSLHRKLLAGESATAVLREVFGDPVWIARAPEEMRASRAQCAALGLAGPDEVTHRRVVLMAAGRPVSDADLWYVPARLWPGMAAVLLNSTTPFGTVVAPMQPRRETLAARMCTTGEAYALHHEAILRVGDLPIALVHEFYRK